MPQVISILKQTSDVKELSLKYKVCHLNILQATPEGEPLPENVIVINLIIMRTFLLYFSTQI